MTSRKWIVAGTPALVLAAGWGAGFACTSAACVESADSQPAPAASQPATQPAAQPSAQTTTHPAVSKQQDEYQGQTIFIAGNRR